MAKLRSRRYFILMLSLAACIAPILTARGYDFTVVLRGERLYLTSPRLHMFEGKPLQRLHDGATVTYVFDSAVTRRDSGGLLSRLQRRFVVSFDLWEEKFSIVDPDRPERAVSHLSSEAAEAWCLQEMPLPAPSIPPDKAFVIKLEWRVVDDESDTGGYAPPLTLASLIDLFSRLDREAVARWQAVSGPLRLDELKVSK